MKLYIAFAKNVSHFIWIFHSDLALALRIASKLDKNLKTNTKMLNQNTKSFT